MTSSSEATLAASERSQAVNLDAVRLAAANLRDAICVSPCSQSHALSERTGGTVFLKLENLQRTGSFKERGALNKILALTKEQRARGLVTASAGNHAQGVAYHSARLGIACEVWMPAVTPLVKVSAVRGHGANVVIHGLNFDETYAAAEQSCRERDMTFVHPFDDPAVIAGQGTIALELLGQIPQFDTVIVPVGGGGLIAGIAVALKQINPAIRVVGVQTAALPSMSAAINA
ncbi:MAG: threonine/serine dehydratase, partial [Terriglobales bacterium]